MRGLIEASLRNKHAVVVFALTIVLLGGLSVFQINIDILPAYQSPAVMVLTFYSGMPPTEVEKDITNRIERWTDMASGLKRQESRSILGASVVYNYFYNNVDKGEAVTLVQSLAQSVVPNMPPGTLPPVVMSYDPTSTTPVCMIALNSQSEGEKKLYDVGRYEVRNRVMTVRGAVSPVVFGGKIRAVQIYVDRQQMQARQLSPLDVMTSVATSNVFLPTGELIVGDKDYFVESNSLIGEVEDMGHIPLRTEHGNHGYLRDVAKPTDDAMIQTTIVRVEGRKQVYVPVMRQTGASTVEVVDELKKKLPEIESQLSSPDVKLELIMDQSVYVRKSIKSLATEAGLGALLCSLVILLFLGRPRMTAIAVMTIPLSILSAIGLLFATQQTVNVMTLSGIAMAIGPMVDSAIICLENIDRLLEGGESLHDASLDGASQVALPELVSSLSTLMVLSPLAFLPGVSSFLFQPMAMAVAFAMATAYLLSRTLVPAAAVSWLKEKKADTDEENAGPIRRGFKKWQGMVEAATDRYVQGLDWVLDHRWPAVAVAFGTLVLVLAVLVLPVRREFFPEVDAGSFEIYCRGPSGTRLDKMNDRVAEVEDYIRDTIPEADLKLLLSEIGVTPDWSAGYSKNAAKFESVIRVQLTEERDHSAQDYVQILRHGFEKHWKFADLEFSFNSGGLILSALNEGKVTPIDIRVTGKKKHEAHKVADLIHRKVAQIDGVVDARILQRQDYPTYKIAVDRAKAADLGLTQEEVVKSVIAALNSSIQFNKHIFWIDEKSGNQYFVGVQYPTEDVEDLETLLNIPVTGINQWKLAHRAVTKTPPAILPTRESKQLVAAPVPLANLVKISRTTSPPLVTHEDIRPTIELQINVEGRDLGHVADDIADALEEFGKRKEKKSGKSEQQGTTWSAYDPDAKGKKLLKGTDISLSGEYTRMQETFENLAIGLLLAVVLIYFMMVALTQSFVVPMCVLLAVPLILIGALPMLFVTETAVNVQSLLGFIFSVGIVVANTVLLTDVAQQFREDDDLSPREAIHKAAKIRARPVTMTALAAFFAMIPTALALEKGSEANAPLGRAILGGLLAAWPSTLFIVPALYTIMVRDDRSQEPNEAGDHGVEENKS
ncbi:MAG TPA: efflux RND transporter permease subunit [Pirellulales bacterium]|nr:efflux RND transporter permease subunit [Pirellulales bacterium]